MDIRSLIRKLYQKQPDSQLDETKSNEKVIEDSIVNHDDDDEELSTSVKEDDQQSVLTETVSNSNSDMNTETSQNLLGLDDHADTIIKKTEKLKSNRTPPPKTPHQSTVKKILIENSLQVQHASTSEASFQYSNSISQAGYHGPMNTIWNGMNSFLNNDNKPDASKLVKSSNTLEQMEPESSMKVIVQSQIFTDASATSVETNTIVNDKIGEGNKTLVAIMAQTKGIRHMIETLHGDMLQLKPYSKEETTDDISHLSEEEKSILKLAAGNLIQAIISTRIDQKPYDKYSSQELDRPPSADQASDEESKQSFTVEVVVNDMAQTPRQHPACVTVQTSFAADTALPRVPTKASVTAINDEEEGEDHDEYEKSSQQMITTSEQFENIPAKRKSSTEDFLFTRQNSTVRNNDPADWTYYSSKRNFYPNAKDSDLPIARSEDQHSSLKQTLLSHFHRRPKLAAANISAAPSSSSLNAISHGSIVRSVSSHCNELNINASDHRRKQYTTSLSKEQQRLARDLLCEKSSFNYMCNKTLNRLRQRIFRVRKSRIIVSFDDIHQQKDAGDNEKNDFETLVNTVVRDMSTEIHRARSQSVQSQPKVTSGSLVSLFQSFDCAIREGESLMFNGNSILQDYSGNEDVLSEISNSLYSVASQTIVI